MNGRTNVPQSDETELAGAIGRFIWSMGQVEWQCYNWGMMISGHVLKDRLIDYRKLGRRVDELLKIVNSQPWSDERKQDANELWATAKDFSEYRNIIAHSPVIMNRKHPGIYGVVDVQELKGSHDRMHRMHFAEGIYSSAVKVQELSLSLSVFWEFER